MNKEKMLEFAADLKKIAEDILELADGFLTEEAADSETPESVPEVQEEKEVPVISLEQVRGVLADKSRSGKTAEVKALIGRHGAERLSDVDPKEYPALLKEAEVL